MVLKARCMGWFCFGLGVDLEDPVPLDQTAVVVETRSAESTTNWLCEDWYCMWLGYDD
jgi:hypothetical protein